MSDRVKPVVQSLFFNHFTGSRDKETALLAVAGEWSLLLTYWRIESMIIRNYLLGSAIYKYNSHTYLYRIFELAVTISPNITKSRTCEFFVKRYSVRNNRCFPNNLYIYPAVPKKVWSRRDFVNTLYFYQMLFSEYIWFVFWIVKGILRIQISSINNSTSRSDLFKLIEKYFENHLRNRLIHIETDDFRVSPSQTK